MRGGCPLVTVVTMQVAPRARALWRRISNARPEVVDPVLAVVFLLAGLSSTAAIDAGDRTHPYEPRNALAFALILCSTVPYALRRRAPLPVFTFSTAALVILSANGYAEGVLPLVALVGAYTVGAHRPVKEAVIAGVVMAVSLTTLFFSDSRGFGAGELAFQSALFGAAILLGWNVQSRRMRLKALERGHEEAARRAASDERLRIAQELHDVVAHSLGVIAVQAGVGSHVLDTDPEEARRALDHIAETSRSSLAEIRRLLGVVRDRDGAPGYGPAPGLADLPRLVDDVRHAGLDVDFDLADDLGELPAGIGLVAYRIVQESLTNTLRHAHAVHASVRLANTPAGLVIEVLDDGRAPTAPAGHDGHGLIGMRERTALYGGSIETGPRAGGGYRVAAVLPLDGRAHEPEPVR